MVNSELTSYTIHQLIPLLRARKVSPTELTQACLDRISMLNGALCTYVTVLAEQALERAREAERTLAQAEAQRPLLGIPMSVKDVYKTKGVPTTWGTKALAEYRPSEDSTVVAKLLRAGAILLAKTNIDVYPYQGTSENPRLGGPTHNPWDLSRTAGRSSGGSAAAVAACLDYGSLGTDNGGSVRIPAAFCGVVGLKPTFGRVSRYGVFPYSDSFDNCGPISRSVYDCALLLGTIAGHDPIDPTSADRPVPDYTYQIQHLPHGLRIGVPREAREGNDPEVTRLVEDALALFVAMGSTARDIDAPCFRDGLWATVVGGLEIMARAETMVTPSKPSDVYAANMTQRSAANRARIISQGIRVRQAAQQSYAEIFQQIDLIITPTVPAAAPPFTEDASPWQRPDELFVDMPARYTRIFNLIGYPAISIPCGFTRTDMPVGLQIVGRPFEEEVIFQAAYAYEAATEWHRRRPALP